MAFAFDKVFGAALDAGLEAAKPGGKAAEDWLRESATANEATLRAIAQGVLAKQISKETGQMLLNESARALKSEAAAVFQPPQGLILRLTFPPMQGALVKKMQAALKAKGFDPGGADGSFGPHSEAAVRGFQLQSGLVPDGEAGPHTLGKLGL